MFAVCILGWFTCSRGDFTILRSFSLWYQILLLVSILWVSLYASRFNMEAIRSGAMELMLVTPLSPAQIVLGQWKALCRTFALPVGFLVSMRIINHINTFMIMRKSMGTGNSGIPFDYGSYQIASMVEGVVDLLLLFSALIWFGMWVGLTSRKISIAALKVALLVWLAPLILQPFVQLFFFRFFFSSGLRPVWFHLVSSIFVGLVKNSAFILWSRKMLLTRFRETVAMSGSSSLSPWKTALRSGVTPSPNL